MSAPSTAVIARMMMSRSSTISRGLTPLLSSLSTTASALPTTSTGSSTSSFRHHSTNPQLATQMLHNDTPSTSATNGTSNNDLYHHQLQQQHRVRPGPEGRLFESKLQSQNSIGTNLVGQSASIRRVFSHASNAQAYLTCGGQELASHASFDPNYDQAKQWIRARPVGPATISPVLIQGLVGTLVEAALPQTVPVDNTLQHVRPLIVGTEVSATVTVTDVTERQHNDHGFNEEAFGYEITLDTQVVRVQDDALIAHGNHRVWIPSYLDI